MRNARGICEIIDERAMKISGRVVNKKDARKTA